MIPVYWFSKFGEPALSCTLRDTASVNRDPHSLLHGAGCQLPWDLSQIPEAPVLSDLRAQNPGVWDPFFQLLNLKKSDFSSVPQSYGVHPRGVIATIPDSSFLVSLVPQYQASNLLCYIVSVKITGVISSLWILTDTAARNDETGSMLILMKCRGLVADYFLHVREKNYFLISSSEDFS